MKSLNIAAAFAGLTAARSVITARQGDVTAEEICDWFETGRHNSARTVDQNCRSAAEQCIQHQLGKPGGFNQLERAKEDINLCTFSPMIGNPLTDFLTICKLLDTTPEACRSHTSWCVMDDATQNKGNGDKNTAPDRILKCVADRILDRDGDETKVECKATPKGKLGLAICGEELRREDTPEDQWENEEEEIRVCAEKFNRNTPATDILDIKQLGQYCKGQNVECSKCKLYLKNGYGEGAAGQFDPYVRYVECQTGHQAASPTPQANEKPSQSCKSVEQQLQEHCGRPEIDKDACMFAARRCTAQVEPDATAQEFLECVDILQVCADQGAVFKLDQCIDNAKACNARGKTPLGDLVKLGQCAKKDL
ncbi:hypothetical protein X797_012282 [Metarhizium robertsii]|uniref:Uncharacterized protein n=2 Tax=Metarhizium robertsii TaxID=568076 RepID=E9EJ40_METRA|nr:uncharacterized protein MAA_00391 [Metarhizium robertsii ARSEF 23]EFZ03317.2 hypothetical protein MAA_00391 [Metarhizium robertsii ARSEF 23]EXU94643.1 hypothetical protein X797_012282 [Metarhizium robertsii]